ncbi:SPFH/Band 7/PHB domain protein [bacterium]|nr:SPFH/Band 7/PHB domain protein [bacterium]
MEAGLFLLILLVAAGFFLVSMGIRVVQQSECVIVERLGSYNRTLTNGLNLIIPFIDQPRRTYWVVNSIPLPTSRLDLRETVLDVEKQAVITKDNVSIEIDAILYVQITDPVRATYEIANLPLAVSQLAQTSLRNVIGEMDLDHTLGSRDVINAKLKTILDEATDKWGTKVNRVELRNITPPREIQVAMEKQMQAERERRAKVLEAEGDKQARISRSEGVRQEQINLSEGQKEAQIRQAQGEAAAIRQVAEAKKEALNLIQSALGNPDLTTQYLVATSYIEEFGRFVQKPGDKVFVPYEASTALGAIGSIRELLAGEPLPPRSSGNTPPRGVKHSRPEPQDRV